MGIVKLCRLCAKEKEKYIDIFNEEGQILNLSTKIIKCLQIWVHAEDILPTLVCVDCCGKLNQSSEFFEASSEAQVTLQKTFEVIKEDQQDSNNDPNLEDCVLTENLNKSKSRYETNCTPSKLLPSSETGNVKADSENSASQPCTRAKGKSGTAPPRVRLEESYLWHCTNCTVVLETPQQLQEHHRTMHTQAVQYQCVECAKVYTVYRKFSRHVRLHRNRGRFSCNQCEKGFSTKQGLVNHAILHSNARPHTCKECGKTFRQVGSLYCHRRLHQPEEGKYQCQDCGKRLLSRQALKHHHKMHTGARDYTCDVCGNRFTVKQALAYHMMSHSGERPFTCQSCDKTFKTVYQLNKHTAVHSDVKAHQCDVCGKQFRERSTLRLHGRIHTGVMPYECEFCGRHFRFKGGYVIHRRQHTGERPYTCLECRRDFTNWANFNKHMKCRHGSGGKCKKKSLSSPSTDSNHITDTASLGSGNEPCTHEPPVASALAVASTPPACYYVPPVLHQSGTEL